MHAIVMAAGEGTRLRPLTERWPKPVLPIDGRPVIATLLRELAGAGCERVYVVTGYLAEQVEELVGDGSGFALDVVYVRQPEALGSADTVRRALAAGAEPPLLVTAADTVYTAGDVRLFVEAARGAAGALAYRRRPAPDPPHRGAVRVAEGRVERVPDDDPANPNAAAPLWVFGRELLPHLDGLPGPPFELSVALQRGIDAGLLIAGIEIGDARLDASRGFGKGELRLSEVMSETTYSLFQQGRAQLKRGMAAQATVALEKAKDREPDKASIREALGIAYFRIRRWDKAEAEFRKLIDLSPVNDYAHYALGRTLEKQGRAREANVHYKLASSLSPGSAQYRARIKEFDE